MNRMYRDSCLELSVLLIAGLEVGGVVVGFSCELTLMLAPLLALRFGIPSACVSAGLCICWAVQALTNESLFRPGSQTDSRSSASFVPYPWQRKPGQLITTISIKIASLSNRWRAAW